MQAAVNKETGRWQCLKIGPIVSHLKSWTTHRKSAFPVRMQKLKNKNKNGTKSCQSLFWIMSFIFLLAHCNFCFHDHWRTESCANACMYIKSFCVRKKPNSKFFPFSHGDVSAIYICFLFWYSIHSFFFLLLAVVDAAV